LDIDTAAGGSRQMPTPYKAAGKDPFNHGERQRLHRSSLIAERTRSLGGWALGPLATFAAGESLFRAAR